MNNTRRLCVIPIIEYSVMRVIRSTVTADAWIAVMAQNRFHVR